jgi:hypothetical protein
MIENSFKRGLVQTDVYEPTLKAYNNSCAEMRSKAREVAADFDKNGVVHKLQSCPF